MTAATSVFFFAIAGTAWIVAVWSAIAVIRLAPAGEKLRNYMRLGWWKFGEIEAAVGPAVVPHLKRYRIALLAFLAAVIGGIVIGFAFSSVS